MNPLLPKHVYSLCPSLGAVPSDTWLTSSRSLWARGSPIPSGPEVARFHDWQPSQAAISSLTYTVIPRPEPGSLDHVHGVLSSQVSSNPPIVTFLDQCVLVHLGWVAHLPFPSLRFHPAPSAAPRHTSRWLQWGKICSFLDFLQCPIAYPNTFVVPLTLACQSQPFWSHEIIVTTQVGGWRQPSLRSPLRMTSMRHSNVDRALHKQDSITWNWNSPLWIQKAILG